MTGTYLKSLPEFKSSSYHTYIKKCDCIVPNAHRAYTRFNPEDISPHHHKHTGGKHARDQLLVPLCLKHHNEFHYNESKFAEKYYGTKENLDIAFETSCIHNLVNFLIENNKERELLCAVGSVVNTILK